MSAVFAIVLGVALLGLVVGDRKNIGSASRKPSRWFRQEEYWDSRSPSQPLNVVLGVGLGLAALIYGVVTLLG